MSHFYGDKNQFLTDQCQRQCGAAAAGDCVAAAGPPSPAPQAVGHLHRVAG